MYIQNKGKEYKNDNGLTYSCQYHVVWCTKYKRKLLVGDIEAKLKDILFDTAEKHGFALDEIEITPSYVHLIVDCSPQMGIMNCVKKLKGTSSHILRNDEPSLKSKVPTLWTRNVFISTAGDVSLKAINEYVNEQSTK